MSKLFSLKKWLTVEDAAKHLSSIFDEPVKDYDILRFALDGHLRLSVNLVNHAEARRGKRVSISDAEKNIMPSLKNDGAEVEIICGLKFYNSENGILHEVIQFDKNVATISGIWDLTMFGGEELDVEREFQKLTNGVGIELVNIDGCYIEDPYAGTVYELQESFDDNEYTRGSLAELEKIKAHIELKNLGKEEADLLINQHKEDRKKYREERLKDKSSDYYPAGRLPKNSVLVVRTEAIADFIETAIVDKKSDKPLNPRTENNYLRLIMALANGVEGFNPTKPYEAAQLIIVETGIENISQQTIADYISKAHALDSKEKG